MFPKVPNYLAQTAPKLPSFPDATVPLVRISLCLCLPPPLKCLLRTYTSRHAHTFHSVIVSLAYLVISDLDKIKEATGYFSHSHLFLCRFVVANNRRAFEWNRYQMWGVRSKAENIYLRRGKSVSCSVDDISF